MAREEEQTEEQMEEQDAGRWRGRERERGRKEEAGRVVGVISSCSDQQSNAQGEAVVADAQHCRCTALPLHCTAEEQRSHT